MKTPLRKLAPIVALGLASLTGCAAASMETRPGAIAVAPRAEVLTRSHFSRDGSGALGEDDLQKVLSTPIDLVFPARVGVVPLASPFDAKGDVKVSTRMTAAHDLARSIPRSGHFSHVSDISTDLPNVGGIEGLRALAARYRLRYLVLYSERFEDDTHANGWAALYPTLIGMFLVPGVTVESRGMVQADLLDVRTGTVLFSVVQPVRVQSKEWMVSAARAHRELQRAAASEAAKALAKHVIAQTDELVAYADRAERGEILARERVLPAPVAAERPSPASPALGMRPLAAQ
jgi:rhombotail lipoprotein